MKVKIWYAMLAPTIVLQLIKSIAIPDSGGDGDGGDGDGGGSMGGGEGRTIWYTLFANTPPVIDHE